VNRHLAIWQLFVVLGIFVALFYRELRARPRRSIVLIVVFFLAAIFLRRWVPSVILTPLLRS